jgi:apolipoprotein N-acyltransferase
MDVFRRFSWQNALLLTSSGILAGLSAPGYESLLGFNQSGIFALLAWVAFVPSLLWVCRQTGTKSILLAGFWVGLLYSGLYQAWFLDIHPMTWLGFDDLSSRLIAGLGLLFLAAQTGIIFAILFWLFGRLKNPCLRIFLFPFLWVMAFASLNATAFSLPWPLLEITQMNTPIMRLIAHAVTGSGLCVLMVFNAALCVALLQKSESSGRLSSRSVSILAFICPVVLPGALMFGSMLLPSPGAGPNTHVDSKKWPSTVAVVQANLPIEVVRSDTLSRRYVDAAYINPVEKAVFPKGTLLIYPEEGVVPGWVRRQDPLENPYFKRLEQLAQQKNISIAVGVSLLDSTQGDRYNALAFIEPTPPTLNPSPAKGEGDNVSLHYQFYLKRRLVPFGESIPYGLGGQLAKLLSYFNVSYDPAFKSGMAPKRSFEMGLWKVGPLICFELIDALPWKTGFSWDYQRQKANLLVTSANLGWFHQNPLLRAQFLAFARLRATETHLTLLLAANTGPSVIVDELGNVKLEDKKNMFFQHKSDILLYNGQKAWHLSQSW